MKLTMTTKELHLLKNAAEGFTVQALANEEGIPKKQMEIRLKGIYQKLSTSDPVMALQKLAQTEFEIVD